MDIVKSISPLVERQFPAVFREESPLLVAFIKTYYEWAEQDENFVKLSRSLFEYRDIDTTLFEYGEYFRKKYLSELPDTFTDQITDSMLCSCRRFMVKHILDLYRSKGTERGYKILFRALYNDDVDFYYPGRSLLRASDGTWEVPTYIEISYNGSLSDFEGRVIQNADSSQAVALCDRGFSINIGGAQLSVLFLKNITGDFKSGDRVYPKNSPTKIAKIVGSLNSIEITSGGGNFAVGDLLNVVSDTGVEGQAVVRSTVDADGGVNFRIISGGYGYTLSSIVSVTGGNGAGAGFQVGSLADVQSIELINDLLLPYVNAQIAVFGTPKTGTVSATAGQSNVIGVGTLFTTELAIGNTIYVVGETSTKAITGITNNTHLTVNNNFTATVTSNTLIEVDDNLAGTVTIVSGQSNITGVGTNFSTDFAVNDLIRVGTNTILTIGLVVNTTLMVSSANSPISLAANVYNKDYANYSFPSITASREFFNTRMEDAFEIIPTLIGRIDSLTQINPGSNYTSNPTVTVKEPDVIALRINDGANNIWGNNAVIEGEAGNVRGIITSVQVMDSGYGYRRGESVTLESNTNPAFLSRGIANVNRYGKKRGSWKNTNSFLNSDKYLIDSYYFQEFSYELQTERDISFWGDIVNTSIHQAGTKMFGKVVIQGEDPKNFVVVDNIIEQV